MSKLKLALLGGAATVALGMSGPAAAFDRVNWEWNLELDEFISKIITIDVTFDPTGVALLQAHQTMIGDVIADATMNDVRNIPEPTREERTFDFTATGSTTGSLDVDGTAEGFVDIDFGHYEENCGVDGDSVCTGPGNENNRVGLIGIAGTPAGESLTEGGADGIGVEGSFGSEDPLTVEGSTSGSLGVEVAGTLVVPVVVPLDAVAELPKVENIATAIGNNAALSSNRMAELHAGQFLFGDGNLDGDDNGSGIEEAAALAALALYGHLEHQGINTYQSQSTALTVAAIGGVLEKSEISAGAVMYDVRQMQMTNAATAVGNNLNVEVDAATETDGVLMGDATQFAYANVDAVAEMYDVSVRNYNNLGAIEGPLFSNVATAIGNNLSVRVTGPGIPPINGGGNGNGNE